MDLSPLKSFENIINLPWHPMMQEYMKSEADIRAIIKGNQGGGCIKIGSKIQYLDGKLKHIEDVSVGDKILSIGDDCKIYGSVIKAKIDTGVQYLVTIITGSGRKITATPCHPFLTIEGWHPLSELEVGGHIAVPRLLNIVPKTPNYAPMPDWIPKILGYLIGDGCTGRGAGFSNRDENIINEIRAILPSAISIKRNISSESKTDYRITGAGGKGNNPVVNLLKETGIFGKNSYTKFVPSIIFDADNRAVSLFISRLFSCDGWVDNKGIGYASVSEELIHDVQSLLLRFGIMSRIRAKKNHNWGTFSSRTEERIDYQLTIRRYSDVVSFSKKIGIFSKQAKLDQYINKNSDCISKENVDIIPIDISYLLDKLPRKEQNNNIQGTNWRYEDNELYSTYRQARGSSITRGKAGIFGASFDDDRLTKLSASDIFWDKIVSITPEGESQCYDLEIEGTHNFIANDIFAHNTCTAMNDAAMRLCGIHPIDKRNRNLEKPIRCVSKVKPQGPDDEENQQYVEFKHLFPYDHIKQDITARSPIMTLRDPRGGSNKKIEFMASTQELDAFMSVQRSALYQDEEIDRVKWDESLMRLLKVGGDATITLTPVRGMDWVFDKIWKRARRISRSQIICEKFGFPAVEETGSIASIEAFCWATDDNPCMTKESIDKLFDEVVDEDDLAMRRYGVFRQVSGRIYKAFDKSVHKVPYDEIFSASLFSQYWNYRIIDFHPQKPWYVSYVAINPRNEWFVWNELLAKHEHKTTLEIRDEIKSESVAQEDTEFNRATLIDPLSTMKQHSSENIGTTVFDDLRRGEQGIRRLMCADTKNVQGRMEIKKRLKNSILCKVPGNNLNMTDQIDPRYGAYLPTLWFTDNCRGHIEHFNSWRMVDYKQDHVKATREIKRESEKYSDYCRNLEFLGALCPVYYQQYPQFFESSRLFQGRRAV